MAKTWHYLIADADNPPPVDEKIFVERCRTGAITDATMVWTQGMDRWQPYGELRAAAEAAAELAERKAAQARAEAEAAELVKRRDCEKCAKDWPESLMAQSRGRWICRPCQSKELAEARRLADERANRPRHFWQDTRVITAFLVGCVALYYPVTLAIALVKARLDAPPTEKAEEWAGKPPDQWPQIALAGDAGLRGWPAPVRVPNACLVVDGRGLVLGVGFSRGFQEAVQAADPAPRLAPSPVPGPAKPLPQEHLLRRLDAALAEWRVGATPPARAVFTKLHGAPAEYGNSEVLLLDPAPALLPSSPLPAVPLRARGIPIVKDLKVFVVGAVPLKPGDKQSVRPGTLHATFNAQKTLDLDLNTPVDPAALTGAPVLDEGGHLLGIVNGTLDGPDKYGQIKSLSAESLLAFAGPLHLNPLKPGATPTPGAKGK